MIRLNLGCGEKIRQGDGWVNVDFHPVEGLDIQQDITKPLPFDAGTVDEIYLQHVVEHIHPDDWPGALVEWTALLKVGGRLVIECPDLGKVCEAFAHDTGGLRWQWWHRVLYGPDRRIGQPHLQGFTIPRLVEELRAAGYDVVRARSWGDNSDPDDPMKTAMGMPAYNLRVEGVKR